MSTKILVVDDDVNICEAIKLYLVSEGYDVKTANDGDEGITTFKTFEPDLVLLDIMMPKKDGKQTCREIREISNKPIIMVTAKDEVFDKVLLLELGADDYLVKPFGMMEMVSRVKAVLRRCAPAKSSVTLSTGGLVVNTEEHTVTLDGERIQLTLKEYEILKLFLSHPGTVYTRDRLFSEIWCDDYVGETRTVDMHIRTLRQKIGKYGEMIETVRGVGYRMEAEKK